jgi:hypothetical protein
MNSTLNVGMGLFRRHLIKEEEEEEEEVALLSPLSSFPR